MATYPSIRIQSRHLRAWFLFVEGFDFGEFFGGKVAWKGLKDGETKGTCMFAIQGVKGYHLAVVWV
jgi:hypothetical protein